MNTIHKTEIINVFWPHYRVQAVCIDCGWWGFATHVEAARQQALEHSLHGQVAA